jgi:uncharacterized protein with PIN domain
MSQVTFRFYGELNEFLPAERRQTPIPYGLVGPTAVKHPIESLGVPHTEVELILANGSPVDFSYLVRPADRISVYPAFAAIDVSLVGRLRPALPSPPRFVVDNHLGKLATTLRLLGFDALYHSDYDDEELAQVTHEQERVLLTRDRGLLKRKLVVYGYCLRTKEPKDQIRAVLRRFDLHHLIDPWRRCLRCNGLLRPVAKEIIIDRLEPKTKKYYHEFQLCQECGQIYWKGSHYEALRRFVDNIRHAVRPASRPD